jgi:hypothetical protein
MTDKKPQTVKSYAASVAERNQTRSDDRRANSPIPNLPQAAVSYDAGRDGPMTMQQLAEAQRRDAGSPEAPTDSGLRPETVEGLKAVFAASQSAPVPVAVPVTAQPAAEAKPELELSDEPGLDDDFLQTLRGIREDVLNNRREKEAVAKRCPTINLTDGLLEGAFRQKVPVVPGSLDVEFRSLTPLDNHHLRLILAKRIEAEPELADYQNDLMSFYQTVASVIAINKNNYASHLINEGGTFKVSRDVLERKINQFMVFPVQIVAAVSIHAAWFDERVRQLFVTAEALKNG